MQLLACFGSELEDAKTVVVENPAGDLSQDSIGVCSKLIIAAA